MKLRQKPWKKQGSQFLCDVCGPIGLQSNNRFSFSSHCQKGTSQKSVSSASFDPVEAYVLRSRWYSAQKMDCCWGYRKRPCPLESVTIPSNKIPCQGSSLFWESLNPHTHIVTSNMLLWGFRHIFLMFYTPYNLHCAERRILLADIIDGACDPAGVKLAERFLSPRRHCKNTHRHRQTRAHTHTHSEPLLRSGNEPNLISHMPQNEVQNWAHACTHAHNFYDLYDVTEMWILGSFFPWANIIFPAVVSPPQEQCILAWHECYTHIQILCDQSGTGPGKIIAP